MDFFPIRTATLRPNIVLGFDVYIQISGKHLMYVKRSDNIDSERLEKLNKKNVRQLFIDPKDQAAYEAFIKTSVSSALKDPKMPLENKAAIIGGQSKAAVEDMFSDPQSERNYLNTKSAAMNQVQLLLETPEAFEHMIKNTEFDKTTYQHSVNVATIAIAMAGAAEASEAVCNAIGTGALLHDIGRPPKVISGDKVVELRPEQMTKEEKEKYFQHPRVGAQLLIDKKYVARDVLDIIVLHEERLDGKGYPGGVKKLDQIFQVVGLANLYDREITFNGKSPEEAYKMIKSMDPSPYDEELIEGLQEVLKVNRIY